jgi:predicted permease
MRIFDAIRQDARYAVRMLLQDPGFSTVAVLSLALGIGANTAIFTLIDTVLLRSLPVRDPEQLVVFALNPEKLQTSLNYPDYRYIRDHNQSFSGVIAHGGLQAAALEVPDEGGRATSQVATVTNVSGNYLDVLGVTPALGRVLSPQDNVTEDAHPWAVLDYAFWQRRFGGDPRVVGRAITLNGSPFTVVGVARAGFTGTEVGNRPDLYVPIMMLREIQRGAPMWNNRHYSWLTMHARLKPGVSMQAAIPEMNVLWKQILASDPEKRPVAAYEKDYEQRNRATLLDGSGGYSGMRLQIQRPLTVLMIVAGLVLLIACANVANLLLARAAARQREIAIRLAIGAGRLRLVSQLILESVVVALTGGVVAAIFAWWGVRVLLTFLPKYRLPIQLDLTPDWRLLAFSFGICLLVGVACGLVPALQATRPNLTSALKVESSARGRTRFDVRRALVVAQVATSLLLLIGAGLFLRSLQNLRSINPGFVRESVLLVTVSPQQSGYKGQRTREFYEQLLARVQALPQVRVASLANITPLSGSRWTGGLAVTVTNERLMRSRTSTSIRSARATSILWASRSCRAAIFVPKTTQRSASRPT